MARQRTRKGPPPQKNLARLERAAALANAQKKEAPIQIDAIDVTMAETENADTESKSNPDSWLASDV